MRAFLFWCLLLFVLPASACDSLLELNSQWLNQNHEEVIDNLRTGDIQKTLPLINIIRNVWLHRDGAISGEVSPYLAEALIASPEPVLLIFQVHEQEFSKWLNELQGSLFTDYEGDQHKHITALRSSLLDSLGKYISSNQNGDLTAIAKRLVDKVETLQVRVVD
jgi:hypothetical protein